MPKEFNEADLDKARQDIIHDHLTRERESQEKRIISTAEYANELKNAEHRFHPVFGAPIASMPLTDFLRLREKYGDEVTTEEFLKYFQREYPELSPNKV